MVQLKRASTGGCTQEVCYNTAQQTGSWHGVHDTATDLTMVGRPMRDSGGLQYDSVYTCVGSCDCASQLVPTVHIQSQHQGPLCPRTSHHSSHRHTLLAAEARPSMQPSTQQVIRAHNQICISLLQTLPGPFSQGHHALLGCRIMNWGESILFSGRFAAMEPASQSRSRMAIYVEVTSTRSAVHSSYSLEMA